MATILDSKIPSGDIREKWSKHKFDMKLVNPGTDCGIVGSTTNANAGRSRRYSFIFIDECFSVERFNEIWRSLQSVARLKVFVSTVKRGRNYVRARAYKLA